MTEYEKYAKNLGITEGEDFLDSIKKDVNILPHRSDKVHYYSFSILTETQINEIIPYGPILEVGAGTGYWAWEFQKRNVDYIATEPDQEGKKEHPKKLIWIPMESLTSLEAIKKYPNRNLLMSWPSYNNCWAYHVLKEYQGNTFIYEGEGEGGCTADDQFFDELNKNWVEIKCIQGLQWPGVHDVLFIYRRKDPLKGRNISWKSED